MKKETLDRLIDACNIYCSQYWDCKGCNLREYMGKKYGDGIRYGCSNLIYVDPAKVAKLIGFGEKIDVGETLPIPPVQF